MIKDAKHIEVGEFVWADGVLYIFSENGFESISAPSTEVDKNHSWDNINAESWDEVGKPVSNEVKPTKKITFETVDKNWQKDIERRLEALESNKPDNSNIIASVDEMVSLLSKGGMPSARTHIDHLLEIKERLEKKQ